MYNVGIGNIFIIFTITICAKWGEGPYLEAIPSTPLIAIFYQSAIKISKIKNRNIFRNF